MTQLILVGTDGTSTAQRAVHRAAELASALGARLHVISGYATEAPANLSSGEGRTEADVAHELARDAVDQLGELAEGIPEVTTDAVQGTPADALVKSAQELDATTIVVGNKRVQGFARVLGSVAAGVAHHAPCDVLIVHTHTG